MSKLHSLEIRNFRGIREFSHTFFDKDFLCLVGRGDSCKTTILEGISILFSPNWNISFYDTDFHNCDTTNNIEITGSLIDLPEFLLRDNKFGLYIRGFDEKTGKIYDELTDDYTPCLTIKFNVTKDLEPSWMITNNRQDPIKFSNIDRAKLSVYLVSDFTDRHFSWNKGNPLYSLLKQEESNDAEERNIILDAIREAKVKIDENSFDNLRSVVDKIKEGASVLGIDISDTKTSIDFKDIFIKENKVCLHDDHVPFRLKGKGSKRLISISIQVALAKTGGIVLIDEIEQGLEPDRIKHLVRTLCYKTTGQFFISTHSQNVIEEIDSNNLLLIQNVNGTVVGKQIPDDEKFQSLVRACPEAMYSQKVIVCEGKTEIGICRALDSFRIRNRKPSMSKTDTVYTIGNGDNFTKRALLLKNLGLKVCVFCDSDKDEKLNPTKEDLIANGIQVFDWEPGNSIEKQIFNDLQWDGIKVLIEYRIKEKNEDAESVKSSVKSHYGEDFPVKWRNEDTIRMRNAIAEASLNKKNEWFKRIDHGEFLGNTIYTNYDSMYENSLKNKLDSLSNWIDND